jgi:hypothetical protein
MSSALRVNDITNIAGKRTVYNTGGNVVDVSVSTFAYPTLIYCGAGNGTRLDALSLTVTPKKSTNIIICSWMITGEMHWDTTWVVHRNGSLITDSGQWGYNGDTGNTQWSGIVAGWYDNDYSSTPASLKLMYQQVANTTSQITITPAVRRAGTTDQWFYINRGQASVGTDAYEHTVSTGYLFEIST